MRARILCSVLLSFLGISTSWAQEEIVVEEIFPLSPEEIMRQMLINNTEVSYFGKGEIADSTSYKELLAQFYADQFRHSQDPRAPYFMLMSRNGKLAMGVGGDLKIIGDYDWDGSQDGPGFAPYNIPMAVDPTNKDFFQLTPNHTSIFFSIFGKDNRFGNFQVYIQGKFSGPKNTFKLAKAYAIVGDWTVGYTKSTFDNPTAQPPTVDTEGPNSEIDDSKILVRYMHDLSKKITFAVSVEGPLNHIPISATYEPLADRMPDIAAFLQFAHKNQQIRLSGIVKNMGYRNLMTESNHHVIGWGVNLGTKLRPVAPLTVFAAFNMGQGIGSIVNDLSFGENDLMGLSSNPGEMYAPRSFGWYGALQYHFSPTVFSNLIFSQERILPKSDAIYDGGQYKYGLYGTANVFWNLTPRVQFGAEFNIGKRVNMDGSNRPGYRAALMADFSF